MLSRLEKADPVSADFRVTERGPGRLLAERDTDATRWREEPGLMSAGFQGERARARPLPAEQDTDATEIQQCG